MQSIKDLHNTLSKIHSMFFNLAHENRLNINELEDYNRAAAGAFESLDEIKQLLKQNMQIIEGAFKREQDNEIKARKYRQLLLIMGLKPDGINILEKLPLRFMKSIYKSLKKYNSPVVSEIHFEAIMQKYRWVVLQIERDLNNIHSIKFQKRIYSEGTLEVKMMVRKILMQIAEESEHIANDIRAGKSTKQLTEKIKNYWYEKLSSHNLFE
jgi:transposase